MKKTNLTLMLATCALLAGGLSGCNSGNGFRVGICQLVTHNALDAATQGFKEELQARMDAAGKTITFDYQNASGDSTTCTTIVNTFVSSGCNLIMANATAALQAAFNATSTIPVLGTSITEYGVATGKEVVDGKLNCNISGTSDLAPLKTQADLLVDVLPDAKKVGILYCSSEPNSVYQYEQVAAELVAKGCTVTKYTFSDTNDIQSVCNTAANNEQAMYVPTDNTVASNTSIINAVFSAKKIPIFAGEADTCKGCGFATLSIDYKNLGKVTGQMAAEILLEGKKIEDMAIRYDENPVKKYNKAICENLGIDITALQAKGYIELE